MIVLAVVLLIIGIALLLLPIPLANKDSVGWLMVALGVILLIVALLLGAVDDGGFHAARYWTRPA